MNWHGRTLVALVIVVLGGWQAASAQLPSADWCTATTENFRIHYPAPWEPWAKRLGLRLEGILEIVSDEVGYRLDEPIDVVIADPESQSNGSAWPLLDGPRTIFWTRPPEASSILGHATDWGELLAIHEIAHLVHLARPSRNPLRHTFERIAPIGPITRKAPRWIFEGYATLVEGRLTGSGRPFGDQRAALIRRFALAGRLPSYPALASDSSSFLGMSMAYLVGSAYLEWLEARVEPGSLPRLWRRLSARVDRSFDDAFAGVYGAPPRELYGRFVAEVTARALEAERQIAPIGREGELWADLSWFTGAPSISPDGRRLAALRRERDRSARLVVWEVADDGEALARREREIDRMLERDPDDVAPIPAAMRTPRKVVAELEAPPGVPIAGGRWTADSRRLMFTRFERGSDGQRHGDLFLWSVDGGEVRRLTHGADLSDADPAPSGDWAVAVRSRFGATGLVRVDLDSGEVRELLPLAIDRVVDRPRISPDGSVVAFLHQEAGEWRIRMTGVDFGSWAETLPPNRGRVMDITWGPTTDHLYAAVGRGGLIDIEAIPVGLTDPDAPPQWHQVTRSLGPVAAPAVSRDGAELYYLALDPDGWDLRRLPLDAATEQLPELVLDAGLAPVAVPRAPAATVLAVGEMEPGRAYGWGRAEWQGLIGGFSGSDGGPAELGVRVGDLVGRWEVLALAGLAAADEPHGTAIAARTARLPVELGIHLYRLEGIFGGMDEEARGAELSGGWRRDSAGRRVGLLGGVAIDRVSAPGAVERDRQLAFAEVELGIRVGRGSWLFEPNASFALSEDLGDELEVAASLVRLGVDARYRRHAGSVDWERREYRGSGAGSVGVGGTPTSLRPRWFDIAWQPDPAVPVGAVKGDTVESQRLRLRPSFLPVALLAERHRADDGAWLELVGAEWQVALGEMPLLRLPALEARIGVAEIVGGSPQDDTRWWAGLVFRP